MRISDVGNTVVYTRGLSEYILLVNGKSQVGIWLRNWVARVGIGERVIAVQILTGGAINFPGLHLLSLCSFASCQGKAESTSRIRVAVY
jgi:hypothetical protein